MLHGSHCKAISVTSSRTRLFLPSIIWSSTCRHVTEKVVIQRWVHILQSLLYHLCLQFYANMDKNKVLSLPLQPSALKIPKNIQHNLQVGQKVSVWRSTTAGSKDQNPPKSSLQQEQHLKLITSEQLSSHHTLSFSENKDTPGEHFKMLLVNSTHSKLKKWLTWEGSTRLLLLTSTAPSTAQLPGEQQTLTATHWTAQQHKHKG